MGDRKGDKNWLRGMAFREIQGLGLGVRRPMARGVRAGLRAHRHCSRKSRERMVGMTISSSSLSSVGIVPDTPAGTDCCCSIPLLGRNISADLTLRRFINFFIPREFMIALSSRLSRGLASHPTLVHARTKAVTVMSNKRKAVSGGADVSSGGIASELVEYINASWTPVRARSESVSPRPRMQPPQLPSC